MCLKHEGKYAAPGLPGGLPSCSWLQNDHGVEAAPAAEHSTDGESVLPSTDDGDDIEPVSDGGIQTRFEAWPRNDKGPGGRWTSKKRASPKEGLTLDLSNLGVDDETLCRVR